VDYLTVEKQLAQCKEHVARIEGDLLIEMEKAEGLQAESNALEAQRDTARSDKGQAHADWVSEGRELRAQIERVWPTRQAAAAELNQDLEKRYTDFRDRGLSPLAEMNGKFCGSCHVSIQDQLRLEVSRGRRIQNCRGCGRWLLPRVDDQVVELAPNEVGQ
jgi:predicted  nucleic acid-binding Zn-ribbon protein